MKMNARCVIWLLVLTAAPAFARSSAAEIPEPLAGQIERVVELLRDPYAVEYPDARMAQTTAIAERTPITLVVFTIEGFGGGNNHTQYLAAFQSAEGAEGQLHYQLLDVIPIGGKGWRAVLELNVRTTHDPKSGSTDFQLNVMKNGPDDAMNSPSIKGIIRVSLKDGRLSELPAESLSKQ